LTKRQKKELQIDKKQMQINLELIAKNSSLFLYVDDPVGLQKNLLLDIKKDGIKIIEIFDDVMDEIFLVAVKEKTQVNFYKSIPLNASKYVKLNQDIIKEDDIHLPMKKGCIIFMGYWQMFSILLIYL